MTGCGGPTGADWPLASYGQGLAVRYLGPARTDTAVDVARATWSSAPAVVLARDDTYPDALAAGPVAAKVGGPVLLTDPNSLAPAVCAEIGRLGASTAYILGDTSAVSGAVEGQLSSCGITAVDRLEGPTRFDTAAAAGQFVGGNAVYVTEGADPNPTRGWPDAVAVSAVAAYQHRPILLTNSDSLPQATAGALRQMGVTQATIVGGSDVVSDNVAAQIQAMGITVNRVSGSDRYGTSKSVAALGASAGMNLTRTWLAIGNNWPDALAAGPAAAVNGNQLLLVDGTSLANSEATYGFLAAFGSQIAGLRLVGGPDVLSPLDQVQSLQAVAG
ncbi:MAG TPA: cell wall-binding repeat-containing protein [Acidimicrobiales bacterium]|nr:cell wall-binding repeat-containing protein [Acidimicrobiales bacterium]